MAGVSGSLFRRVLFWSHLSAGVVAGLFILIMSVTGVLLTYEHQIVTRAESRNHSSASGQLLPLDDLARAARAASGDSPSASLVISAEPTAPVAVSTGRETVALLNPITGATLTDASAATRGFFRTVEDWHRWLGGKPDSVRASLLDYANLLFLFITISGLYLWLPAVWRWRTVRGVLLFQRRYINAKVRDFNWHHVFGAWMLVPLFIIALSGVVMSFPWANNAVFAAFGEDPPRRSGPPGAPPPGGRADAAPGNDGSSDGIDLLPRVSLQQVFNVAVAQAPDWQRVTLPMDTRNARAQIAVELKSTERRPPRRTVVVDTIQGTLVEVRDTAGAPPSPGQKARVWFRFAHTGEQYGVVGQTIAGIASLAACFLVYTGLALAWRRLVRPALATSRGA